MSMASQRRRAIFVPYLSSKSVPCIDRLRRQRIANSIPTLVPTDRKVASLSHTLPHRQDGDSSRSTCWGGTTAPSRTASQPAAITAAYSYAAAAASRPSTTARAGCSHSRPTPVPKVAKARNFFKNKARTYTTELGTYNGKLSSSQPYRFDYTGQCPMGIGLLGGFRIDMVPLTSGRSGSR